MTAKTKEKANLSLWETQTLNGQLGNQYQTNLCPLHLGAKCVA